MRRRKIAERQLDTQSSTTPGVTCLSGASVHVPLRSTGDDRHAAQLALVSSTRVVAGPPTYAKPAEVVGLRGFFIFIFFISVFYKNIFSICKFTEIYPGRPAAGGAAGLIFYNLALFTK